MERTLIAAAMARPHLAVVEPPDTRALQRLYLRRAAVEDLIRSLEEYQASLPRRAPCIPLALGRRARKIAFDGELDKRDEVADVQLAHQSSPIGVNGLRADMQQLRDILCP